MSELVKLVREKQQAEYELREIQKQIEQLEDAQRKRQQRGTEE